MKCKVCGGTGTSNTCVNGTFKPCSFCDGTSEYEPFAASPWNKDDLLATGIWAKYEEPKYKFDKSFEKFIKKWLRMQKKNRRRWG